MKSTRLPILAQLSKYGSIMKSTKRITDKKYLAANWAGSPIFIADWFLANCCKSETYDLTSQENLYTLSEDVQSAAPTTSAAIPFEGEDIA